MSLSVASGPKVEKIKYLTMKPVRGACVTDERLKAPSGSSDTSEAKCSGSTHSPPGRRTLAASATTRRAASCRVSASAVMESNMPVLCSRGSTR